MDFRGKMPKVIRCLLLLIAVVLLAVGCTDNKPAVPQAGQTPEKTITETSSEKKTEMMTLTLYFATKDASALVAEKREVAKNVHPARAAVEELIAGPKNADLVKVIPGTTRVKDIRIKDHVAYVDFSEAFVKEHGGGSAEEILTVSAVSNTLTELPEVKRVQFMVEGKNLETLNGHLDLSEPLLRNEAIIKK